MDSQKRPHVLLPSKTQLNVCKLSYGDFVVWTEGGIAVERIFVDKTFYETVMQDVEHFFIYGILPEIIGKWYTRKPVADGNGVVPFSTSLPTSSTSSKMQLLMRILRTTAKYGAIVANQVLAQ